MTTQQPHHPAHPTGPASGPAPDLATGDAALDAYTVVMAGDQAPILGHLVLYSVFDGHVTRDTLERWFTELSLDVKYLPPPLRAVDAYEKVTGPDGVRVSYPLDDPAAAAGPARAGRPRRRNGIGRSASLMVRPVRRDGGQIIRHVVREVRDEQNTKLSYDTRLAACIFQRDNTYGSEDGGGTLHIEPDNTAIAALPQAEQTTVRTMLADIENTYSHRCSYLSADRLRAIVRTYIEDLGAIRVRKTGGVYFVHRPHADTLAALRELVARFAHGSHLVRIPLPDQDEMREMVISAFTTKAKDDLDRLAADIAAAQRDGRPADVQKLYHRFAELQHATSQHATLLNTSLDDTNAALQLVKTQLGSLLATAGGDDDDSGQKDGS
jgi:hypothetical protein